MARPPGLGGFVATRAMGTSQLAAHAPGLKTMRYWVWRVVRAYQVGEKFDEPIAKQEFALVQTYECHLYVEAASGMLHPVWHHVARAVFIRTLSEKARRKRRRLLQSGRAKSSSTIRKPVLGFLRGVNLVGCGFHLTSLRRVPKFIRQFLVGKCS